MSYDVCPYCRGTNIRHTHMDDFDPPFTGHFCEGCRAYNLEEQPGCRASEEEMATGWYGNEEDYPAASPFNPRPKWTPATRRQMHLWALEVGVPA